MSGKPGDATGIDATGMRVAIVASRFNADVVDPLIDGAKTALAGAGAAETDITLYRVPGSFELAVVAQAIAEAGEHDCVVCLGVVIRGDTPHFEYVSMAAALGISEASRSTGIPIAFGVLTTDNLEQALERAGGRHGNKGADAALAAVETAQTLRTISG